MELYILRHAIAEDRANWEEAADHERPLTRDGEAKMRRIAQGMKALDLSFQIILSSPFCRAKQTAEIVGDIFEARELITLTPALAAGEPSHKIVSQIEKDYPAVESILLVGHEPDLSGLVSLLVSGDGELAITLKKGGLCKLKIDSLKHGRCATLEWLLAPSQLIRIRS